MPTPDEKNLIWLDLEMTGLEPEKDSILEIATVVTDRYTGESKGFGFVEMSTDGESNAAIKALNGTMMNGRSLTVNEAKPREDRGGGGGGSYGGGRSGGGGSRGGGGGGGGRW